MRALFTALLLLCTPLNAQDRTGRDTPGDWIVDHHQRFGLWDSMCDHRTDGERTEQRCYIRYVDVFSPRPAFAALYLFLTPGPEIEIGIEVGTRFSADGMRVERGGAIKWSSPRPGCLVGLACTYQGRPADYLLGHMADGGTFAFDFTDRHGQPQSLRWDLAPFAAALADFRAQTAVRGL